MPIRTTLVATVLMALIAVAAIGVFSTAAATKTRLVIVNGHVGRSVNVCIDGRARDRGPLWRQDHPDGRERRPYGAIRARRSRLWRGQDRIAQAGSVAGRR